MESLENKKTNKSRYAVYIRCTPEEHALLEELTKETGESAATLLKKKFFEQKIVRILFPKDDRDRWFTELRRIGNNVNQIAKKLNTNVYEGWYPEILDMAKALARLQTMVVSVYGRS